MPTTSIGSSPIRGGTAGRQAVVELADQQQHLARRSPAPQGPLQPYSAAIAEKPSRSASRIGRAGIEFDPHEEFAIILIVELLRFENVAATCSNR
jgi:hypothetical protein